MSHRKFALSDIKNKLAIFHECRAAGMRVHDISRRLGITDTTLYNWLAKHDASRANESQLQRLKRENARLRKLVVARTLAANPLR
jgi:transposase-like protein